MINLKLYDTYATRNLLRTYLAIKRKAIIFVSMVKLVHTLSGKCFQSLQYEFIVSQCQLQLVFLLQLTITRSIFWCLRRFLKWLSTLTCPRRFNLEFSTTIKFIYKSIMNVFFCYCCLCLCLCTYRFGCFISFTKFWFIIYRFLMLSNFVCNYL